MLDTADQSFVNQGGSKVIRDVSVYDWLEVLKFWILQQDEYRDKYLENELQFSIQNELQEVHSIHLKIFK